MTSTESVEEFRYLPRRSHFEKDIEAE